MKFIVIISFFFFCLSTVVGKCPDKLDGIKRWSTWASKPTQDGASVTISDDDVILLDVSPPRLNKLDIYGILVVDPNVAALAINASFIYVRNGATFYIGSENCPLSNNVTITLVGTPQPNVDPDMAGTKVLAAFGGGTLEIHGKVRTPTWTVLQKSAKVNDSQITLSENVDWAVGETIVIASTDFEENFNDDPNLAPTQNEVRVITGRPAPNVVEFDQPLSFLHYGKIWTGTNGDTINMRGEVGLLTRNIVIRGDLDESTSAGSQAAMWGGHVMLRDGGVGRIEYVEVYSLGQKSEFGRYPLHFHYGGSQPNSYFRGNSVHDTFQRCIVAHSTSNLRVLNNVAYRGVGHCYFIEDGNEQDNVFQHNLGVKALVGTLLTSDSEPAMFWITNPKNHFYENVAVGGKFGFWYSMPVHPLGLADSQVTVKLRNLPSGDFVSNKAHGCNNGLFVDRGLENAKPGSANALSSYNPVNWTASLALAAQLGTPIDVTTLDEYALTTIGVRTPAAFVDFTAYKCIENGMWGRGSFLHSYGAKLADNVVGCTWPGNANLMQKTVMVGETDNVGSFNFVPQNKRWWGDEEGRSRPQKYFLYQPIMGYSSYDAGGGDIVMDINFHNYNDFAFSLGTNAGKVRKTGAITGITGPNAIEPTNRIYRAKFYNVDNRFYLREYYPWYTDLVTADDAMKGFVTVDADGSLLAGTADAGCGKQIVGRSAVVRNSACVRKQAWGDAWVCPANSHAQRAFYISQDGSSYSGGATNNKTVIRQQTDLHIRKLADGSVVDVEANLGYDYTIAEYAYGTNLIANQNYYFTLGNQNQFLAKFTSRVSGIIPGESFRMAFPYPSATTFTIKSGWDAQGATTQVYSYSELGRNKWFFDDAAGVLWLHYETIDNDASYVDYVYYYGIPLRTGSSLMSVVASSCGSSLCTYSSTQAIPSAPSVVGQPVNLCETGGAVTGGVYTYTQKTTDSQLLFTDDVATNFKNDYPNVCNITKNGTYSGSTSLFCTFNKGGYWSISRVWASYTTPVYLSKYTHLQFAMRAAPGFGDSQYIFYIFNQSYTVPSSLWSDDPSFSDDAGPITDRKWSVLRVPVSKLVGQFQNFNLWGLAMYTGNNRPTQVYIDEIKFVSLTPKLNAIANFPVGPPKPALVNNNTSYDYDGGSADGSGSGEDDNGTSSTAPLTCYMLALLVMMVVVVC